MSIIYILSWIATILQLFVLLVSLAAGLYYLAELVEEYTVLAKKVITWVIFIVIGFYVALWIFDSFPLHVIVFGIASQVAHLLIMKNFPNVVLTSIPFISALILIAVNHLVAFRFFAEAYQYISFSEALGYFTLCVWLVPFVLTISLSANDYVLPTTNETSPLLGNEDVVSKYFSQKGKRYGLLYLFSYAKETFSSKSKKLF